MRSRMLPAAVLTAALVSTLAVGSSAEAATVDTYRIELKAWIPHSSVTGPPIAIAGICNSVTGTATYNGNDHVGYDGGYKALVAYEFTFDGAHMADKAVDITYGGDRRLDRAPVLVPGPGYVQRRRAAQG